MSGTTQSTATNLIWAGIGKNVTTNAASWYANAGGPFSDGSFSGYSLIGAARSTTYACIIRCDEVVKDDAGNVVELRCFADLSTRTGEPNAGKKVKGTIHWVSATRSIPAEVRLYDRLFTEQEPEANGRDFKTVLNPNSLEVLTARLEPSLAAADPALRYQFERLGYFCLDADSRPDGLVFNRTIPLKDAWAKESAKG
jgi:glutaminyl-tRNA synthetase